MTAHSESAQDGRSERQVAEDVRHELLQPKGYFKVVTGDMLPWFDQEGRAIVLLLHGDGSVTWQMRGRNGEVLEPEMVPRLSELVLPEGSGDPDAV